MHVYSGSELHVSTLDASFSLSTKPFAHMRLHQEPGAVGYPPAIKKLILDLIHDCQDNIMLFEGLQVARESLSLGRIEFSQPCEVFI